MAKEREERGMPIELNDRRPHAVSELICVKCLYRFISVRPVTIPLKKLECPMCKCTGYLINTGEIMKE